MRSKWDFFVAPEDGKDKKNEKEKAPNKFLGWMSFLIKRKKGEPLSLNLSRDEENKKMKHEITEIPAENREEAEAFLAEEVAKIEERRDSFKKSDELDVESMPDNFEAGEKVLLSGDGGWQVESVAGGRAEVGRVKKDPLGRDVYERRIVSTRNLSKDLPEIENELKKGDNVSVNGEVGWEIVTATDKSGRYLEVGRVRADKKGTLVFERKIVGVDEVEKI